MAARPRRLSRRATLVLPALLVACFARGGGGLDAVGLGDVGVDDERRLGAEFDLELHKHVAVIDDPVVSGFIHDLGQSVVRQIEPQPFIYRFRVIADPRLNAFAVPGGFVYFHSGTLLAAGSVDELAGVMGHEIAHVKAHHYARMRKQRQIPDLLGQVAAAGAFAAAVATREPGLQVLGVAAQGVNEAVGLRFSREFEAEADHLGAIWLTRAGYDPAGVARFFERILEEQRQTPTQIPPYLYSHPAVEERIATVEREAAQLRAARRPPPAEQAPRAPVELARALPEVQARLRRLLDEKRARMPLVAPPANTALTDPLLAEADRLSEQGRIDEALQVLARAERAEPNDPRVPFRSGELLERQERHAEAVEAYRRTVHLDTSKAQVFYRLGRAYKRVGDRQRAVYALEQAAARAAGGSDLERRCRWEIEKLTFPVLSEAGVSDGATGGGGDTPAGASRESFRVGDPRFAWWGRLGPRFASASPAIHVRWTDPAGAVTQEQEAVRLQRGVLGSRLEFGEGGAGPAGTWRVEALLDGDVVDRREVELFP